jgi:hypothetical protein
MAIQAKGQEKNVLLISIVQTVTYGIYYKFPDAEQRESNYGWIINASCR